MMNMTRMTGGWIALLALTIYGMAQEKRIDRSALPSAVVKTIDQELHGATVKGFSTDREHGKRVYEAETMLNGHSRDLQIAEDGTLNEVEEEVAFDALPSGVQHGLTKKAKGARITKVESLRKYGTLVAYEASTLNHGHTGEVQVGPEGATLAHAE